VISSVHVDTIITEPSTVMSVELYPPGGIVF